MWFLEHAYIIPVISAVSFALILLFGKRAGKALNYGATIGVVAILANFLLACAVAYQWVMRVRDVEHSSALGALVGSVGRSFLPRAEEAHAYTAPVITKYVWWQAGGMQFSFGSHIDGLAVALLLVVTIISSCVHIFSLEYMRGDIRFTHYYAGLSLFTAGMLCLVVAQSTLQLLLGWEIMGLCSFMLIGHWWEDKNNSRAALKAFFTTRTGDIGLLVGITIVFWGAHSFGIQETNVWALSPAATHQFLFWGSVALFIAVIGKSGQFPLHTWLPDAMAGPTPVSALIHAATMVVAGVYLVARLYPVFYRGFSIGNSHLNGMAIIGGITIIIAAALAFVQTDIKKVLAYSTVSQLGYMVMGLGVGAWTPAVFHIFTHAFFKAGLFLGAGSISHSGSHHSFDMKKDMGGLRKYMPITFVTFIVCTLALCGIFPFAGFFSKDEILATAGATGYSFFKWVGLAGAFMTAAYMTRCVYLTFFGEYRGGQHGVGDAIVSPVTHEYPGEDIDLELAVVGVPGAEVGAEQPGGLHAGHGHSAADLAQLEDPHNVQLVESGHPHDTTADAALAPHDTGHGAHVVGHGGHDDHHAEPHESPALLTGPLILLAILATLTGFLLFTAASFEPFKNWVETGQAATPSFPTLTHPEFHFLEAAVSVLIALAGIVVSGILCKAVYERSFLKGFTRRNVFAKAGYAFLWNKYYLDDLYEKVVVAGISGPIARASNWFNQNVIDAVVNGAGVAGRKTGEFLYRDIDQRVVDTIVNGAGEAAEGTGESLRPVQSGRVQQYGALLFGAAAVGALILILTV